MDKLLPINEFENKSSSILRAIRKHNRLTQHEFAEYLGITQGALSKIEANILELSAAQWVKVCDSFKIPCESLKVGKVDLPPVQECSLIDRYLRVGSFKMPTRYNHLLGQTTREATALLAFADKVATAKVVDDFLTQSKIDRDYFTILNHPLSINFLKDLYQFLTSHGTPQAKEIVDHPDFLVSIAYFLNEFNKNTGLKAFKNYVQFKNTHCEVDAYYEVIEEDDLVVRMSDADHLRKFDLPQEFLKFRQLYSMAQFEKVKEILKIQSGSFRLEGEGNIVLFRSSKK